MKLYIESSENGHDEIDVPKGEEQKAVEGQLKDDKWVTLEQQDESSEILTEEDIPDFIQKKDIRYLEVALPEEFKALHSKLKQAYKAKLKELQKVGFNKPDYLINKKDLIIL